MANGGPNHAWHLDESRKRVYQRWDLRLGSGNPGSPKLRFENFRRHYATKMRRFGILLR